MTIDEFAEQHRLEWVDGLHHNGECYAHFFDAEVRSGEHGTLLASEYGSGSTRAEARRQYARNISWRVLVCDAYGDERREIRVPELV